MASVSFEDDSRRILYVAILSIFSFIATVAVIFRLWARKIQRCKFDLSDYLIMTGLVWALGLVIFTMYSYINWHLGEEITQAGNPEASPALIEIQMKALLVGQVTWAVSVFLIRASIMSLYIHVFRIKSFRLACCLTQTLNAANFITVVLSACLICRPFSYSWNRSIPGGVCGDQRSLDIYIGIFNLILDFVVVSLPIPVLWGLQLGWRRKAMLSGMFGLGFFICAITLVRIKISADNHGTNAQATYSLVALFTGLESTLGVINACFPVMKPVFIKLGSLKSSHWMSSAMSGSIPVFIRPSQMGSNWKSAPSRKTMKRNSTIKQTAPTELHHWRSSSTVTTSPVTGSQKSAPPQHALGSLERRSPGLSTPSRSLYYGQFRRREPDIEKENGIYVQREWGVERGESQEMDRALLKD